MKNVLLISTRKGLVIAEEINDNWKVTESHFDSIPVTMSYEDPRNGNWWVALDHGHWGVKLHRSDDKGKTWKELTPPTYPEGAEIKPGIKASTTYIWSINHGGLSNPERMIIGTIPGGLFISEDNGVTWNLNSSLWNHESRANNWFGGGFDHPGIHSINLDPRDENKIQIGISCAGVFESEDNGNSWFAKNKGLTAEFLPDPNSEYGHDPHLLIRSKNNSDCLWQQNHCGIFKSSNNGKIWEKVSQPGGPAHFGFAIAVAEDNYNQVWVAPAIADEKRIPIDKALCICRTDDGGKNWIDLRKGLPQENCFDIVYRHSLLAKKNFVAFGTTTGNVYYSKNKGDNWIPLSNNLAMVHALTLATK